MKVFVYGTLRKGGRFHGLIADLEFLGNGYVEAFQLYDLGGDVPGIVPCDRITHTVNGEVYALQFDEAEMLRRLEYGYTETGVTVYVDGEPIDAVAYVWPDKTQPYVGTAPPTLVPSGDWMER